ncbi:MAG: hypothetical protein ACLFUE_05285 [Desulfobacteraceae bacterium]
MMSVCEKCGREIKDKEEEYRYAGRLLCEDCYIDAVFSPKACDPWAVYSAKTLSDQAGGELRVTETQKRILDVLKDTGGAEPEFVARQAGIDLEDLQREIAALRHMEMVRAELRDGKKVIRLW